MDAVTNVGAASPPVRGLAPLEPAELPAPPASIWPIVGPGIVAAGVGLGSGEFVFFPYVASQIGLGFLWAAVVGVGLQFILNMEFERYTLATGETALTGFSRLGRHWGLVFVVMTLITFAWPGWATGAATLVTYLVGGNATWIAIAILLAVGCTLTLSPIVYRTLERAVKIKVAAVMAIVLVSILMIIPPGLWVEVPALVARPALPAEQLGWALVMGAIAFAGLGGAGNLCQSNWIRDKGFGMGVHAPRIASPLVGEPVAMPGTGWRFEIDETSLARWRGWWRMANIEQLSTFVAISLITIIFMSILAYAVLFGRPGLPSDISFLALESEILSQRVGAWFGRLFLAVGAVSLFATAIGVVDISARLTADVIHTSYRGGRSESLVYALVVWTIVAVGLAIVGSGLSQPLVLLVLSACLAGLMMFVYSGLVLVLNNRLLPAPLRPSWWRNALLAFAFLFFGAVSLLTLMDQVGRLTAG